MSAADFCCPHCAGELTIEQLFGHQVDHRAFLHLATISVPVGAQVLRYLQLFAPPKNRLTIARKAKLLDGLLPDLQRQSIAHNGRVWEAPLAAWSHAIDAVLAQRDTGKLRLPLTNHGYLYAVLAGMADKVERSDEHHREATHKHRAGPSAGFTSVADVMAANPHLKGEAHD